jgi:hypothetical protein
MSVFDLPRLHFSGVAVTRLPTGPRAGRYDLGTNLVLTDDGPYPPAAPPQEYHALLERSGVRFEPDGTVTPEGRFHSVKGWNFGGNGHFWVDAKVVSWEREPGVVETEDPVVGRNVDMWGHYNDYLATTANRARVFDVDPASNRTTTLMVGRLGLGRLGRSHDVEYLLIGDVAGNQPPRWRNSRHIADVGEHILAPHFRTSVVHQFVVDRTRGLHWLDRVES